jgi:preprotein translocase subunit YajC
MPPARPKPLAPARGTLYYCNLRGAPPVDGALHCIHQYRINKGMIMAETNAAAPEAAVASTTPPAITQGQTTSVGENTEAVVVEPVAAATEEPSLFSNPLLWIVAALWIWFLFGNKKRKAQKAQEKKDRLRRETLQKGDEIITIGRMHGTVVAFTEATVTIKPDLKADYTMTFDRAAIYRVLPRPGEEDEVPADAAKK